MSEQEYSLLSRVFTRAVLQEFSNKRTVDNVFFLRAVDEFISEPYTKTYANIFEILYDRLKKEYRNEYFYKNILLNKLLLGVHSTNTTTALAELLQIIVQKIQQVNLLRQQEKCNYGAIIIPIFNH